MTGRIIVCKTSDLANRLESLYHGLTFRLVAHRHLGGNVFAGRNSSRSFMSPREPESSMVLCTRGKSLHVTLHIVDQFGFRSMRINLHRSHKRPQATP